MSCAKNEKSNNESDKSLKTVPSSVSFNGDIGYLEGSTWQSITESNFETLVKNVFGLETNPNLSGFTVETLSFSGQADVYILHSNANNTSFGFEILFDDVSGVWTVINGSTACACSSTDCGSTCNPKKDIQNEWYCSECDEVCTKVVMANDFERTDLGL